MKIKVRGFLTVRKITGRQTSLDLDAQEITVSGLLERLSARFGADFEEMFFDPTTGAVSGQVAILINGRHYTHLPRGLDTPLQDGDDVALFPPIAGG